MTRPQLLDLGFSYKAIARLVDSGYLHEVHRGVFSVGHTSRTRDSRLHAATLAAGDGCAITAGNAAREWGWTAFSPSVISVAVPGTAGRTAIPGLKLIRSRRDQVPRMKRNGIWLTTPEETLRQMSTTTQGKPLETLVDRAIAKHELTPSTILEPNRAGAPALRSALERVHPEVHRTRSELERVSLRVLSRLPIDQPKVNHVRGPYEIDLTWDGPRLLIVELDGYGFHRSAEQMNRDLRRANDLQAQGHIFRRFTWQHLEQETDYFESTVLAARALALTQHPR